MGALALSAQMNLNGTFYAQMQRNLEVINRVKSVVPAITNQVKDMGSTMSKQASETVSKWEQVNNKIQQVKKNISNSAPIQSLTKNMAVARDAAGVAGLATAGFLKGAIDAAAKGQKTTKDLEQTIKSTGGAAGLTASQISTMATDFTKISTYGAGAIKSGQSMLLTFTNIGKDVFPGATQAMLDMSTKMGSDLPSTAIQLGKSLNDPVKGVTALTRVGVTFTAQQKEQIAEMVKVGNTAGAQKLILGELNKEFGGQAAAAAQTYQGRLTQLSNTIGAIKGSIGAVLLPYVQKVAEAFLSVAQRVQSFSKPMIDVIAKVLAATAVFGTLIGGMSLLQKIIPMVVPQFSMISTLFTKLTGPIGIVIALFAGLTYAYEKNLGGFKTAVDNTVPKVEATFKSLFTFITSHGSEIKVIIAGIVGGLAALKIAQGITTAIKTFQALKAALEGVKIAQLALNAVTAINPFAILIAAIGATVAILIYLWNTNKGFRDEVISIWNSVKSAVGSAVNSISLFFTGLVNHIKNIPKDFEAFKNNIVQHIQDLHTKISNTFNAIKTTAVSIWTEIKTVIIAVVTPIVQGVLNVWNSMKGGITTIFTGIKNVIQGVWSVIKNIILGPVILIVDLVRGNWTKLGSDAKAIFTNLGNAFKQIWNGIKQIISGYLSAIAGLVSTIWGGLVNIVKAIWNGLGSFLSGLWNGIKTLAIAGWEGLKTGVITIVQDVWLGIVTVFTSVVNFFKNLPTTLYNLGVAIFTGLKNGAWSILSTIGSWIETGFNAVVDFFSNLPSKMLEFGKNFIQGFINGVEGMIDAVINKVKNVGESIEKTIRKVLGINSPSKVMHGIGQFVVQGLANGISTSTSLVNNAALKLGKGLPNQFYGWGQDIPDSLANGIANNMDSTTSTVTDMANRIRRLIHFTKPDEGPLKDSDTYGIDMVKSLSTGIQNNMALTTNSTTLMATNIRIVILQLIQDSLTYGQQIVTNLGQGVKDSTENLTSIVKSLTDKVIETFKTGFGIHSPSRVMYQMGGHLMQGLMNGMTSKDMQGFVQNWIGSMTGAAGGAVSGNLSGWISAAMALTGVSADWFNPLATLIQHESGGDPMSINLWDSNAAAGHPSKGLMQLIDENMSDHHLPGMDNIYDPISNIAAGIRLIQHDYGNIYNVPGIKALARGGSYVGYALGTTYATPGYHVVGEHGPELLKMRGGEQVVDSRNSKKLSGGINIAKLADQIIVREDADVDKIATTIVKKMILAGDNM